jgi:hypothetical protein
MTARAMVSDPFLHEFHRFVDCGVFPRPNRGERLEFINMFTTANGALTSCRRRSGS